MGQRGEDAVRLVEADVAIVADAQQLNVHAAAIGDLALIIGKHGLRVGGEAVRHVGVLRLDVDVVKEVLLHKAAVALRMVGSKALVLVEVEGAHAGEVYAALLAAGDELAVERQGRGAGRQAQHAGGPGLDLQFKKVRGKAADVFGGIENDHLDPHGLSSCNDVLRRAGVLALETHTIKL